MRRVGQALLAVSGPEALVLRTPVDHHGEDRATVADSQVGEDRLPFTLTWNLSHEPLPDARDPLQALADTDDYWRKWAGQCTYRGSGATRDALAAHPQGADLPAQRDRGRRHHLAAGGHRRGP